MRPQPLTNRQIVLKARPFGIPQAEHFELRESPVAAPRPGEFLVRNDFVSIDSAMRTWTNLAANYGDPVKLGDVMRSFSVGEIVASKSAEYKVGERVMGMIGWQDYHVSDGSDVRRKVLEPDLPLSLSLGVLGINGVTAHFAMMDAGRPRAGDTVVISSAADAVGSAAGQFARTHGCRTIGVAGSVEEAQICVRDFQFDAAIDYKGPDFEQRFIEACTDGVNIYFDNTAGTISDAVHRILAKGARIVVCGTASIASWEPWPTGPRVERYWDYEHRYDEAVGQLAPLVRSGVLGCAQIPGGHP